MKENLAPEWNDGGDLDIGNTPVLAATRLLEFGCRRTAMFGLAVVLASGMDEEGLVGDRS